MDTAGLECLDWANNHHLPEDLHLNNSHKEKTLDHPNLNLLATLNGFSQKSEEDLLKDAHEITDLKKNVNNNNNTNNNYNNMPPNQSDIITEAEGRDSSCGLPAYLPENNFGDLKYDLSTLHLSDKASLPFRHVLDAECESVHSDYSEVVGPLRDLADNDIDIFQAEDLQKENLTEKCNTYSIGNKTLKQQPDETDEEFKKRVKKVNFLSLAQEFAELKKIDADVLPFDLHKTNLCDYSPMSEESSLAESAMTTPIEPGKELLCSYEYVKDENSNELDSVDCCDPETIMNDEKESRSSLKPKGLSMTDSSKLSPRRGKPNLPLWENKPKYNSANNELNDEEECEIYDIENTLPKMDWESLELQLAMAAEEKERLSHFNDREEIRRKLAMGGDEECYGSDRLFKKSNMQARYQGDLNLQLCFMNDAAAIPPNSSDSSGSDQESVTRPPPPPPPPKINLLSHLSVLKPKYLCDHSLHHPPNKPPRKKGDSDNEEEDFFRKQARLQEEAKLALAQASTMAHMQLEVEKQMKKKSPIAEMVGIPGFGDGRQKRLHRKLLLDMNVAQLQVIVNDLLSQIKSLNEDLVQMLLDRDDLHMEQDSMLVDIEDLTSCSNFQ